MVKIQGELDCHPCMQRIKEARQQKSDLEAGSTAYKLHNTLVQIDCDHIAGSSEARRGWRLTAQQGRPSQPKSIVLCSNPLHHSPHPQPLHGNQTCSVWKSRNTGPAVRVSNSCCKSAYIDRPCLRAAEARAQEKGWKATQAQQRYRNPWPCSRDGEATKGTWEGKVRQKIQRNFRDSAEESRRHWKG